MRMVDSRRTIRRFFSTFRYGTDGLLQTFSAAC
jgi:hypothetical protein